MARRIHALNARPLVQAGIARFANGRVELVGPERIRYGHAVGGCENCGGSLEGRRADARTCSDACRQALYRRRGTIASERDR